MKLYNAALTPWHAQPKRRKAVAVRRKRSHNDDGQDSEDDEEESRLRNITLGDDHRYRLGYFP